MILELKREGLGVSAIARQTGLDRKTVRKYLKRGLEAPVYGPRDPGDRLPHEYRPYLLERLSAFPGLSVRRLHREIKAMGYAGAYSTLTEYLRLSRPDVPRQFERRFETLPGEQAQADFAEFIEMARNDPAVRRLTAIPGVGVLNATALIAAVGNAGSFAKAHDLGAWLGLVPKQHTTGGRPRLLGISKQGNTYLRTLLIHGARAALPSLSSVDTPLGHWLKSMIERGVHRNVVVVALANKLARVAWAALRKDAVFDRGYAQAV